MSKKKRAWDVFVVVLAIFNSFAVPLEFVLTDFADNPKYEICDGIITVIFMIDIIVAFNTEYIDVTGE